MSKLKKIGWVEAIKEQSNFNIAWVFYKSVDKKKKKTEKKSVDKFSWIYLKKLGTLSKHLFL